jgi:murein L,D-transpeptidase YafK
MKFSGFLPSKQKLWQILKDQKVVTIQNMSIRDKNKLSFKKKLENYAQDWLSKQTDFFRDGMKKL